MRMKNRGEETTRIALETALGSSYGLALESLVIMSSMMEISWGEGSRFPSIWDDNGGLSSELSSGLFVMWRNDGRGCCCWTCWVVRKELISCCCCCCTSCCWYCRCGGDLHLLGLKMRKALDVQERRRVKTAVGVIIVEIYFKSKTTYVTIVKD